MYPINVCIDFSDTLYVRLSIYSVDLYVLSWIWLLFSDGLCHRLWASPSSPCLSSSIFYITLHQQVCEITIEQTQSVLALNLDRCHSLLDCFIWIVIAIDAYLFGHGQKTLKRLYFLLFLCDTIYFFVIRF